LPNIVATTQTYSVEVQAEVQSLTRAHDLSQQEYKAGSITLTDVLDADRQLLAAQGRLTANRADAARASVLGLRSFRAAAKHLLEATLAARQHGHLSETKSPLDGFGSSLVVLVSD
jgi:outer membrane protein TolC